MNGREIVRLTEDMQVKDDGGSECSFVMNEIGVTALSRKAAHFHQVRSYDEFIRRFLIRQSK
jgi:hypothetical protein